MKGERCACKTKCSSSLAIVRERLTTTDYRSRVTGHAVVPLSKIVSGGQTGVDRGALDAALEAGFPCGGWSPPARLAEDGPIPARYPLAELEHGGYSERTLKNVVDSDGTVIFFNRELEGGTRQTHDYCVEQAKPVLLIDAARTSHIEAADKTRAFIARGQIAILNVAGPRASKWPQALSYARSVISLVLARAEASGNRK